MTVAVFGTKLFIFCQFMALLFGWIPVHYLAYYSGWIKYE